MSRKETGPMKEKLPGRRGLLLLALALGAGGGYLYHRLVGCPGGGCPISASPYLSVLWGTAIGGLLGFALLPARRRPESSKEDHHHA
jgi:hypothetical protein